MAGAIPFFKLAALLVRTLAKPIASRIKIEATRHPVYRQYCTRLGQGVHHLSSRINILASGYQFFGVKPLPAEEALNMGVNFLSEFIIFLVGGIVVIVEYRRGEKASEKKAIETRAKEKATKEELDARFDALEQKINSLRAEIEEERKVIRQLHI